MKLIAQPRKYLSVVMIAVYLLTNTVPAWATDSQPIQNNDAGQPVAVRDPNALYDRDFAEHLNETPAVDQFEQAGPLSRPTPFVIPDKDPDGFTSVSDTDANEAFVQLGVKPVFEKAGEQSHGWTKSIPPHSWGFKTIEYYDQDKQLIGKKVISYDQPNFGKRLTETKWFDVQDKEVAIDIVDRGDNHLLPAERASVKDQPVLPLPSIEIPPFSTNTSSPVEQSDLDAIATRMGISPQYKQVTYLEGASCGKIEGLCLAGVTTTHYFDASGVFLGSEVKQDIIDHKIIRDFHLYLESTELNYFNAEGKNTIRIIINSDYVDQTLFCINGASCSADNLQNAARALGQTPAAILTKTARRICTAIGCTASVSRLFYNAAGTEIRLEPATNATAAGNILGQTPVFQIVHSTGLCGHSEEPQDCNDVMPRENITYFDANYNLIGSVRIDSPGHNNERRTWMDSHGNEILRQVRLNPGEASQAKDILGGEPIWKSEKTNSDGSKETAYYGNDGTLVGSKKVSETNATTTVTVWKNHAGGIKQTETRKTTETQRSLIITNAEGLPILENVVSIQMVGSRKLYSMNFNLYDYSKGYQSVVGYEKQSYTDDFSSIVFSSNVSQASALADVKYVSDYIRGVNEFTIQHFYKNGSGWSENPLWIQRFKNGSSTRHFVVGAPDIIAGAGDDILMLPLAGIQANGKSFTFNWQTPYRTEQQDGSYTFKPIGIFFTNGNKTVFVEFPKQTKFTIDSIEYQMSVSRDGVISIALALPPAVSAYVVELQNLMGLDYRIAARLVPNSQPPRYEVSVLYGPQALRPGAFRSMTLDLGANGQFARIKSAEFDCVSGVDGQLLFEALNRMLIQEQNWQPSPDYRLAVELRFISPQEVLKALTGLVIRTELSGAILFGRNGANYKVTRGVNGEVIISPVTHPFEREFTIDPANPGSLKVRMDQNGNVFVTWNGKEYKGIFNTQTNSVWVIADKGDPSLTLQFGTKPDGSLYLQTFKATEYSYQDFYYGNHFEETYIFNSQGQLIRKEWFKTWTVLVSVNECLSSHHTCRPSEGTEQGSVDYVTINGKLLVSHEKSWNDRGEIAWLLYDLRVDRDFDRELYERYFPSSYGSSKSETWYSYDGQGNLLMKSWQNQNDFSSSFGQETYIQMNGKSLISHSQRWEHSNRWRNQLVGVFTATDADNPMLNIASESHYDYIVGGKSYYDYSTYHSETFYNYDSQGNQIAEVRVWENYSFDGTYQTGGFYSLRDIAKKTQTFAIASGVNMGDVRSWEDFKIIAAAAKSKTVYVEVANDSAYYPRTYRVEYTRGVDGVMRAQAVYDEYARLVIVKGEPDILSGESDDMKFQNGQKVGRFTAVYSNYGKAGENDSYHLVFHGSPLEGSNFIAVDFPLQNKVTLDGVDYQIEIDADGKIQLTVVVETMQYLKDFWQSHGYEVKTRTFENGDILFEITDSKVYVQKPQAGLYKMSFILKASAMATNPKESFWNGDDARFSAMISFEGLPLASYYTTEGTIEVDAQFLAQALADVLSNRGPLMQLSASVNLPEVANNPSVEIRLSAKQVVMRDMFVKLLRVNPVSSTSESIRFEWSGAVFTAAKDSSYRGMTVYEAVTDQTLLIDEATRIAGARPAYVVWYSYFPGAFCNGREGCAVLTVQPHGSISYYDANFNHLVRAQFVDLITDGLDSPLWSDQNGSLIREQIVRLMPVLEAPSISQEMRLTALASAASFSTTSEITTPSKKKKKVTIAA